MYGASLLPEGGPDLCWSSVSALPQQTHELPQASKAGALKPTAAKPYFAVLAAPAARPHGSELSQRLLRPLVASTSFELISKAGAAHWQQPLF